MLRVIDSAQRRDCWEHLEAYHNREERSGENWLSEQYFEMMVAASDNPAINFRMHTILLVDENEEEATTTALAGKIGFSVGRVYTSLGRAYTFLSAFHNHLAKLRKPYLPVAVSVDLPEQRLHLRLRDVRINHLHCHCKLRFAEMAVAITHLIVLLENVSKMYESRNIAH